MLLYIVKYSLTTENYRRPQVRTLVQGLYFQMLDAGVRCPCMLLGIKAPVLGVEIKASQGGEFILRRVLDPTCSTRVAVHFVRE